MSDDQRLLNRKCIVHHTFGIVIMSTYEHTVAVALYSAPEQVSHLFKILRELPDLENSVLCIPLTVLSETESDLKKVIFLHIWK